MKAFHNSVSVKNKYLTRIRGHRLADELLHQGGVYWHNGQGCAVGCTLHSHKHANYETELGIPLQLGLIQEALFEMCGDTELALSFPERFLSAIPVGADLSGVTGQFMTTLPSTDPEIDWQNAAWHVVIRQMCQSLSYGTPVTVIREYMNRRIQLLEAAPIPESKDLVERVEGCESILA